VSLAAADPQWDLLWANAKGQALVSRSQTDLVFATSSTINTATNGNANSTAAGNTNKAAGGQPPTRRLSGNRQSSSVDNLLAMNHEVQVNCHALGCPGADSGKIDS
jgi:hypothetical protein